MNWYALFVETGKEDTVKTWLHYLYDKDELGAIVPKRKLVEFKGGNKRTALKPMFPGYVLVYTNITKSKYNEISRIPSVISILTTDRQITKIDEREIEFIVKLLNYNDIIDYSKIIIENQRVSVKSGPLCGYEGIIKKIDKRKKRAKIQVNFLGDEKLIDVGVEILSY